MEDYEVDGTLAAVTGIVTAVGAVFEGLAKNDFNTTERQCVSVEKANELAYQDGRLNFSMAWSVEEFWLRQPSCGRNWRMNTRKRLRELMPHGCRLQSPSVLPRTRGMRMRKLNLD